VFRSGISYQQLQTGPVKSPSLNVVWLKTILLVLTCSLVNGCGSDGNIQQPLVMVEQRPLLVEVIPVATAPKTLSAEVAELLKPEVEPRSEADPVLDQVVLDLNLSAEILATGDDGVGTLQLDMNRLPDLFEQPEKQAKTSFHVELLRNDNFPHVTKTIDGLNLTIERRLGG
jgi:hypothetical protein